MSAFAQGLTGARKRKGTLCQVLVVLTQLPDDDDREALKRKLAEDRTDRDYWTSKVIAQYLNDEGFEISYSSVMRHRAGGCKCERDS